MRVESAAASIDNQKKLVAFRMGATLLGGTMLVNAYLSDYVFRLPPEITGISAFTGALLLGVPIVWQSIFSLWKGKLHMQELVALAIIACFALQDYKTAGIVAFIMLGAELVQSRTALGAKAAIEGLIRMTPTKARKIITDNEVKEIPASTLTQGDIILVLAGDNIAADGIIKTGNATLNEASITGESLPVEKKAGDTVFAGTVNLDGTIKIEVTRAGEDTTLGKVKKLILEAEDTKTPIMRIIDQYTLWYTPVIIMIAGLILYFTKDMSRTITALVVTCPCALILATPTAIVASLTCAARLGILVKNVAHLEIAANLSALVFDKTGTLTTGNLTVTQLSPVTSDEDSAQRLLAITGTLAQYSNHPVSKAVFAMAKEAGVRIGNVDNIQEQAGFGLKGNIYDQNNDSFEVLLGNRDLLLKNNITVKDDLESEDGISLLYVGYNKKYIGKIGLQDQTRPEAKKATDQLHDLGIKKIIMLTGDRETVAKKVANELGCQDYKAHCLPEEKLEVVHQLKNDGYSVGVIGDGINDAPALAAGDIGIAMGAAGSDIAINSASISLMNNDLLRLPFVIKISRKTRIIIFQNLIFGIFFIVIGLILSGLGYINPILAAILHNVGSFVVIFNSARLVRFGEELTPFIKDTQNNNQG